MPVRCLRCTEVLGVMTHNHTGGVEMECLCPTCFSLVGHKPINSHVLCFSCGSHWHPMTQTSCLDCLSHDASSVLM